MHDGKTLVDFDGQNTTRMLADTRVLVVADTLSNQRQELELLIRDPRPAEERLAELDYQLLAADPYSQMCTIAHEAFHAFQAQWVGERTAVELLLLHYPTLSVENNVGMALEGEALKSALFAGDVETLEASVLSWLAIRRERRAALPPEAIQYEDGTELNEGLAKYVEWRLSEALEGRTPGAGMAWVSGFSGYGDLGFVRQRLAEDMRASLAGEKLVNNDPYGTAPVRFRLYYSGMAMGALLDRLMPEWKARIMQPGTTLSGLVREALDPGDALLDAWTEESRTDPRRAELVASKTRLAEAGRQAATQKLAGIYDGKKTLLCVDYTALGTAPESWSFTPFGITVVDEHRTIYDQIPVSAQFADGSFVRQTSKSPLVHDMERRWLCCQLAADVSAEAFDAAMKAAGERDAGRTSGSGELDLHLELPGVELRAACARASWEPGRVTIELLPRR